MYLVDREMVGTLLLNQYDFTVLGRVYRVEKDKMLKIVPPESDRCQLFLEVK